MTTEEKDGAVGDEYLDAGKNPMIKLPDIPDEKDDVDIEPYRAPFGPTDPDEVEAMATQLLGKADTRIDDVGEVEVRIDRDADGLITINGRAPGKIDDNDRAALMVLQGQDSRKAQAEKEASDDRDVSPKSNPMIRLEPPDD